MKDNTELQAKVKAVVGDQVVGSAEDLVVAVCQVLLLQYSNDGLTGTTATTTTDWSAPGLPQTHRVASYDSRVGIIEVKWIAMGDNHVMMLLSRANSASSVRTIALQTSSVVRSAITFPLNLPTNEQGQPLLAENAASRVSAAIYTPLSLELTEGSSNETTGNPPVAAIPAAPQQTGNRSDDDTTTIAAPAGIGQDDLNPLGTKAPPPFSSGIGNTDDGGGGMVVGPGHPLFRCEFDTRGVEDDSEFNDPSILPAGAVPPGARFDPVGPFGPMPGPSRPQGGRGRGRGRGRGPGRFFSGEPDPDIDQPPNSSWNYYL